MADIAIGLGSFAETDVASAATCDIGATSDIKVRITGSVTITSFGSGTYRLRFIRFAAALTLTHNAVSLRLPTNANIAVAAGDTCFAMSTAAGNWVVVQYQRDTGFPLAGAVLRLGGSGAASTTGDAPGITTEITFATVTVPAGLLGPNGWLEITCLWTFTNNANNKIARIRLNGIAGTAYLNRTVTTNSAEQTFTKIRNRNAQNSQVGFQAGTSTFFGASNNAHTTSAIDTSAAVDLVISGQLANGADTIKLEAWDVKGAYGA